MSHPTADPVEPLTRTVNDAPTALVPTTTPPAGGEPPALIAPRSRSVHVRSLSLAVLATIATIAALRIGSEFFVPVMLALVASYSLTPLVDWLENMHVPRVLGAALVVLGIVGGAGWLGYSYADEGRHLIDALPPAAEKLRVAITRSSNPRAPSTLEKVEQAAETLQRAATADPTPAPRTATRDAKVMRVQVEQPKWSVRDYLWTGTRGLISAAGQLSIVLVLTFFLLSAGSMFRRKMLKLAGPRLSQKRVTLEALDEISGQVQRYMVVMVLVSALTGVATWAAFALIGLNNAVAWGALAGVLNLIPYFGSIVLAATSTLMAYVQFGTFEQTAAIALASLMIHTIIGQFLTPWLTGRASSMNTVTVFVGVLAWGWLWGLWGLFLAVPILVIVKVVSDRIEDLKPIGEFLGD